MFSEEQGETAGGGAFPEACWEVQKSQMLGEELGRSRAWHGQRSERPEVQCGQRAGHTHTHTNEAGEDR